MIDGFRHLLAVLWDVEPEDIEVERGIKDVHSNNDGDTVRGYRTRTLHTVKQDKRTEKKGE